MKQGLNSQETEIVGDGILDALKRTFVARNQNEKTHCNDNFIKGGL